MPDALPRSLRARPSATPPRFSTRWTAIPTTMPASTALQRTVFIGWGRAVRTASFIFGPPIRENVILALVALNSSGATTRRTSRDLCNGRRGRMTMGSAMALGSTERRTHAEVDVLVAGAGAAGMTAALVCAIEGLDVLLCEKSAQVGGTTATAAGTIWIPGTKQAFDAGHNDNIVEARRYLDSIIGPDTDGRREVYLATGPEVVDYLARHSEVKFSPYVKHPDYLSNRPGWTVSGRPLAPVPFDGRLLGKDFPLLRPP